MVPYPVISATSLGKVNPMLSQDISTAESPSTYAGSPGQRSTRPRYATSPPKASPVVALLFFSTGSDLMSLDDFGFDFNHYSSPAVPPFSEGLGHSQPLHSNLAQNYPPSGGQPPAYGAQSPAQAKKATNASKRTASRQISLEEQSRIAAEEDKRRRNTAASARFRVKKKIREQALEKREKELSDEVSALNKRIMQLETENKFLKNLVVEKTGAKESKFDAKLAEALEALSRSSDAGDGSEKTKSAEYERAAPVA